MNVSTQAVQPREAVHVTGAGPAGPAAAITLARAGREVIVHEAHNDVGRRFQRDVSASSGIQEEML